MTENIPESPIWTTRYINRLKDWYYRPKKDFCFVIMIDEVGNETSDWCEIKNKTVSFEGGTYDSELAKSWFGRKTLLVLKGTRLPPDFSRYNENFVNKDNLEGKNTPLSYNDRVAHVKMNSRNAFELASGLKRGEYEVIAVYAAAIAGIVAVALLYDVIHMPMYEFIKHDFVQELNNTRWR